MQEFLQDYLDFLKNWNVLDGKQSRKSFWKVILSHIFITLLLYLISLVIPMFSLVSYVYLIVIFIPFITMGTRRFHDVGRSATTWIFILVPIIGWIFILYIWSIK